jgi:hypothetical protein
MTKPEVPDRSVLRVRARPHSHPDQREDTIIEVMRDGDVAATIYGSREGIHIVSARLDASTRNSPFRLALPPSIAPTPGIVVPLLAEGERCPWCGHTDAGCPVCSGKES